MSRSPIAYLCEEELEPTLPAPRKPVSAKAHLPPRVFSTWTQLKEANARSGEYFFVKAKWDMFRLQVDPPEILHGRFFITSGIFGDHGRRQWKIREVLPTGHIRVLKYDYRTVFDSANDALITLREYLASQKR